ncbi:iron ABC transporter permease [bacterium]|nr:iron ABC transporter permease [bacterium]
MKDQINNLKRFFREPVLAATVLIIAALLVLFVLYPIGCVFYESLLVDGELSLSRYNEYFSESYLVKPFFNSIKLGTLVAIFGTLIGYFFAYSVTHVDIKAKKFFSTVATFPIISPPFVIALAAILLFGRNGLITKNLLGGVFEISIYGMWGLVIVETLAYFPTAFMVMRGVLKSINPDLEEAALNLGASKLRVFFTIVLPLSFPGIASSLLLIFIESLADFGNPLILSGDFSVLSVQAYLQITGMYDTGGGATLSIMLLFPSLIAFSVQKYIVSKKSFVTVTGKPAGGTRSNPRWFKVLIIAICCLLTFAVFLFYGTLIIGAFVKLWGIDYSFTLANFTKVFSIGKDYIIDSLQLAAIATPLIGIMGMLIAYIVVRKKFFGRKLLEFTSLLTFAVPGTVVGIGYIMAFNESHWFMPWILQGTPFIIILIFVFRNMPVGIQAGTAALAQIDPSIEEASASLGAGSLTTFKNITLPLMTPAFLSGLVYGFVKAMTAISAVVFVVSGNWNLITIYVLSLVETGELSSAAAMSLILVSIILVALGIIHFVVGKISNRYLTTST